MHSNAIYIKIYGERKPSKTLTVIFSKLKTLVVHTVLSDTTKDCYNMTLLLTPIHHVTLYIFVARLCEYVSESKFFSFYSVRALDQRKKELTP